MTRTTRAQRLAIKRIFLRTWLTLDDAAPVAITKNGQRRLTYRAFRRFAQPTFGCDGAIAIPWCGMWLCIEADGYTHS